jgi:hypothetical protein
MIKTQVTAGKSGLRRNLLWVRAIKGRPGTGGSVGHVDLLSGTRMVWNFDVLLVPNALTGICSGLGRNPSNGDTP